MYFLSPLFFVIFLGIFSDVHSYGLNRQSSAQNYSTSPQLIQLLVRTVSRIISKKNQFDETVWNGREKIGLFSSPIGRQSSYSRILITLFLGIFFHSIFRLRWAAIFCWTSDRRGTAPFPRSCSSACWTLVLGWKWTVNFPGEKWEMWRRWWKNSKKIGWKVEEIDRSGRLMQQRQLDIGAWLKVKAKFSWKRLKRKGDISNNFPSRAPKVSLR